ncbi:hypothetical protein V6N12_031754 [Hibiscus sabdariffa]|uniref:Secreted protein n=1 Tax=Hibiscus sabdariffa TaxID=183260 RepID=A0ABR2DVF2_9ROSI
MWAAKYLHSLSFLQFVRFCAQECCSNLATMCVPSHEETSGSRVHVYSWDICTLVFFLRFSFSASMLQQIVAHPPSYNAATSLPSQSFYPAHLHTTTKAHLPHAISTPKQLKRLKTHTHAIIQTK